MRTIKFLLQKEFLQIFRNKGMLPIMFAMPVIQLIILSNAATFDVKNVNYHFVDKDRSAISSRLSEHFYESGYFTLKGEDPVETQGIASILHNEAQMLVVVPKDFEKDLLTLGSAKVQIIMDAQDGYTAGIVQNYTASILQSFNQSILETYGVKLGAEPQLLDKTGIEIRAQSWYNPELDYKIYMVPGILVVLITMIGLFLSGMNIVREREIGTIEQLNVTPIKRYQFIVGKLLPFWIIGIGELTFGLAIARIVFHVPMQGSFWVIYLVAAIYLLAVLGIGLFISTLTDTQQQAMFIAWFFMVIFVLMSGLFTAVESMPKWAQTITLFNPVRYFVDIMRRVMLKGSGLADIQTEVLALSGYAVVMIGLSVNRYRKASA
ncbi:ABC-2 type transporter [Chloroherpeton thalassium ATCC 35110]|uniref:ABC-2 type transporter n=1 Tax=Chloroherpeton thalassium (strain ATCC 35110 / GB-78) TaxID=517418 RepID=B3QZ82_CHLT3|nr:ABC transporter permease [Chloroherpeton thalassium]ACF13775.1 ABC-2 type transporter [Chloroherpeton thalassium ATCC 35110]